MSNKRDRKRQKRRREHQRVGAEASRERKREDQELATHLIHALKDLRTAASNISVAPDDFAEQVSAVFDDELVGQMLSVPVVAFSHGGALAEDLDGDRVRSLADSLTHRHDAGFDLLAAGMLVEVGDHHRGEGLLEENRGLETVEGAVVSLLLARVRLDHGDVAGSLELLDPHCAVDPANDELQQLRALALGEAHERATRLVDEKGPCPCGSDRPWRRCCEQRERDFLARFADRSDLYGLREGLDSYVKDHPDIATWQEERLGEWLEIAREAAGLSEFESLGGDGPDALVRLAGQGESDGYDRLAAECSWFGGPFEEPGSPLEDSEVDAASILNRFAEDPATSPDLAAMARDWLEYARYGLWQVAEPEAAPGIWLTDLVTRRAVYASAAPEQLEGLPRWSALLGPLVPVGGIWRTGGAFVVLDPLRADRIAEHAMELGEMVAYGLAKEQGVKHVRLPKRAKGEDVPPYSVLAGLEGPMEDAAAGLYHKVVCVGLPQLVGMAEREIRRTPQLTNTDGDPLEMITARVPVAVPDTLRKVLSARKDFELDTDDGSLRWMGRELTPSEVANSLAQARASAAEQGLGPIEMDPLNPQRWIRGSLSFEADEVVIEVNSRRRLEALSEVLRGQGIESEVTVENSFDPVADMAFPRGFHPVARTASKEADKTWRAHWLEEKVPALGNMTPRQAARDPRGGVLLEQLLRKFEHDADRARLSGEEPMDVASLRRELDMEHGLVLEPEDDDSLT